jgi:hypothetical protein
VHIPTLLPIYHYTQESFPSYIVQIMKPLCKEVISEIVNLTKPMRFKDQVYQLYHIAHYRPHVRDDKWMQNFNREP